MATNWQSRSITKQDVDDFNNMWAEWDDTPVTREEVTEVLSQPKVLSAVFSKSTTATPPKAPVVKKEDYEKEAAEAEYIPGLFDEVTKDEGVEQDA